MFKNIVFLIVLFLISCIIIKSQDQDYVVLSADDINKQVLGSKDIWVVGFTGKNPGTTDFESTLQKVYEKVNPYDIKVGLFDCNPKENEKICKLLNSYTSVLMHVMPASLLLFADKPFKNPYTGKFVRQPIYYTELSDNIRPIEKFISNSINPINMRKIEMKSVDTIDNDIENFNTQTVLIVGGTSTVTLKTMLYKSLASAFRMVNFVVYKSKNNEYKSKKIEAKEKPTIYYTKGEGSELVPFDGTDVNSRQEILSWLSKIVDKSEPDIETTNDSAANKPAGDSSDKDKSIVYSSVVYTPANLTDSTLSEEEEWHIAVIKSDIAQELIKWNKVETNSAGKIHSAILICDNSDNTLSTLGKKFCDIHASNGGVEPYVITIPFGSTNRKKFLTSDEKFTRWITKVPSSPSVSSIVKTLGKTLPDSSYDIIEEDNVQNVLQRALSEKKLTAIFMANKLSNGFDYTIRNIAVSFKKYFEVVVILNPQDSFMQRFGFYNLPIVMCMAAEIMDQESEPGQQQIVFKVS